MENARFKVDIEVDEVALHEVYLPHFRRIVDEGVASVMSAYNKVNGEWCGESRELLTDILRGEWGFEGFVISDWVFGLRDAAPLARRRPRHRDAGPARPCPPPRRRARGRARRRGTTSTPPSSRLVSTLLRFDDVLSAARRRRRRHRLDRAPGAGPGGRDPIDRPAPQRAGRGRPGAAARRRVRGSPCSAASPTSSTSATTARATSGTSSAAPSPTASGCSGDVVTVDDGDDLDRAAASPRAADVAVVVVGYTRLDEGEFMGDLDSLPTEVFPAARRARRGRAVRGLEGHRPRDHPTAAISATDELTFGAGGDRTSLRLPDDDVALIRAVAAANPRTVVVIQSGSAVVCSEWIDDVPAVVQAWYGGSRGRARVSPTCSPERSNPSGRLPVQRARRRGRPPGRSTATPTRSRYDRWHGWWHLARTGRAPAFPFGFGLAYTTFALDDVTVDVGRRAHRRPRRRAQHRARGRRRRRAGLRRAARAGGPARLVGFARVEVPAGGEAECSDRVPVDRLATRDPIAHAWRPASGPHHISVARHAGDPDAATTDLDL